MTVQVNDYAAEVKKLNENVAKLTQVSEDAAKTHRELVEKYNAEVKSGTSPTEIARLAGQITTDVLPKLAELNELRTRLSEAEKKAKLAQDAVAALELKAPGQSAREQEIVRNIGRFFTDHAQYKSWRDRLATNANATMLIGLGDNFEGKKSDLGAFWNAFERKCLSSNSLEFKALGEWGGSNVSAGTRPMYRPDIVENPRRMPVMRGLVPTIPTIATNSVISTRESARRRLAAKLTAIANSGATTFTVDNIQGFEIGAPFNTLTLNNGSTTEDLTIDSINRTTGVITTTAASSINMAVGDWVYGSQFIITAEGQVAPRGITTLANYTVPICRVSTYVKASLEMLRDVTQAEDFINRNLMDLVADSEDAQFLYGQGGSSPDRIKGLYNDSDVVKEAKGGAVTVLDHILENIHTLAGNNYIPNASVVSVNTHKALTKLKDSTGNYLLWVSQGNGGMAPTLNVTRLIMSNMLISGHAIVGDFTRACTIYDRETAEIGVHEVGNDALEYQRTMIANERVGFGIERPLAVRFLTSMT